MGNSDRRGLARVATDCVQHIAALTYYSTLSRLGDSRDLTLLFGSRCREVSDAR